MSRKIVKQNGAALDEFEQSIETAILDLQNSAEEEFVKALKPLYISSAKEVDVGQGRKAIVLFVPVPLLTKFHAIQKRLVRELEKKYSGKHVIVVAQRRILRNEARESRVKQPRPRSRTLTAVHDNILEDVVYPSEIHGKRIRFRLDGSRLTKVLFDKKEEKNIEHKVETFSAVYKKLTGKAV
eukprot:Awhi_evm1s7686